MPLLVRLSCTERAICPESGGGALLLWARGAEHALQPRRLELPQAVRPRSGLRPQVPQPLPRWALPSLLPRRCASPPVDLVELSTFSMPCLSLCCLVLTRLLRPFWCSRWVREAANTSFSAATLTQAAVWYAGQHSCRCGAEQRKLPCTQRDWQCARVCGKSLGCGRHTCQETCHAGACASCPLQGPRSCPCGKVSSSGVP